MKISILINTRNRPAALFRCLQSALAQEYPDFEILVLNDHTTANQEQMNKLCQESLDQRVLFFRSDKTLGVAAGRNFLMQRACGKIFCIIDDDAIIQDIHALKKIREKFESYPAVGILAFPIVDHSRRALKTLVPFSRRCLKKNPQLERNTAMASYFLGGCHALRNVVWQKCGGYSEKFFFGEEELDLSYKAIRNGFQILYIPDIAVHHRPEPSATDHPLENNNTELYYHITNRIRLAYTYLPLIYIPSYLTVWLAYYGLTSINQSAIKQYLKGLFAGLTELQSIKREPLEQSAIAYLKKNFGRMWY